MVRRQKVRGWVYGAHLASTGPALVAGFLQNNLTPAALWIAATATLILFGKETP